jgi:hypothetical protein
MTESTIYCHSTRIPVVCSFVAEAEYAGLYATARPHRDRGTQTLDQHGPPPNSPPHCFAITSNEVAIRIAADTISQRMSKATDMRLHWIRDRVHQGYTTSPIFSPITKPLPVARHPSSRPGSLHRRRFCRRRLYYSFR